MIKREYLVMFDKVPGKVNDFLVACDLFRHGEGVCIPSVDKCKVNFEDGTTSKHMDKIVPAAIKNAYVDAGQLNVVVVALPF